MFTYYKAFKSLYDYFAYCAQKEHSIETMWSKREAVYNALLSHTDILFENELKLIIAVKAYMDNKDTVEKYNQCKSEEKKIKNILFCTEGDLDLDLINDFCVQYKKARNTKLGYSSLFKKVSSYIETTILNEMNISVRTFERILKAEIKSVEYLAAVCRCLDLDVYISTDLFRKIGFDLSIYSPSKEMRAINLLLTLPHYGKKECGEKSMLKKYEDDLKFNSSINIKLDFVKSEKNSKTSNTQKST